METDLLLLAASAAGVDMPCGVHVNTPALTALYPALHASMNTHLESATLEGALLKKIQLPLS